MGRHAKPKLPHRTPGASNPPNTTVEKGRSNIGHTRELPDAGGATSTEDGTISIEGPGFPDEIYFRQ